MMKSWKLAALAALGLCLTPPLQADDVDLVQVFQEIKPHLKSGRGAKNYPLLEDADLRKVAAGEIVLREYEVDGKEVPRTIMAKILPYPAQALYLVIADLEHQVGWVPGLTRSTLIGSAQGGLELRAVQVIEVPPPGRDRSWYTEVINNKALYEATGGRYWEIYWDLDGDEMKRYSWENIQADPKKQAAAKAIPQDELKGTTQPLYSRGAWVIIPLGDNRTYVEYDSFTDPDLNFVEDTLAWAFGSAIMRDMFTKMAPLADAYTQGKAPPSWLVDMEGKPTRAMKATP